MLKIKSILVSLLAVAALASCSDDNDNLGGGDEKNYDAAYMSISLSVPKASRTRAGSTETGALESETKINEIYLILFDKDKKVVKDKDASTYYSILSSSHLSEDGTSPLEPFKVSFATKYLLVIANPGAKMKAHIAAKVVEDATYATINTMFSVTEDPTAGNNLYLIEEVARTNSYTMINAGEFDDTDLQSDNWDWKADCLLDVSGSIIDASKYKTEAEAKAEAVKQRAKLQIERLAAKIAVTLKGTAGDEIEVLPVGAEFVFAKWTIDYVNSQFFPFATKTKLTSPHSPGEYKTNFYTVDPNFTDPNHRTGIILNQIANYEPKVKWYDSNENGIEEVNKTVAYTTENTMAAAYQKLGGATRLVLKANYVPKDYEMGKDWYQSSLNGVFTNYETLTDLQTAYNTAKALDEDKRDVAQKALVISCEAFKAKLDGIYSAIASIADFKSLTQGDLDALNITNGGEVAKGTGVRWFQKSLNYYYYEIRHDNGDLGHMAYGKYGVVRNNYYTLQLTKVNGAGTPWYPDVEDPEEDIDKEGAYLHFEISVAPWVSWATDFEI